MKKVLGNYTSQSNRDFPLDCETLEAIKNNQKIAEIIGNLAGDKCILFGCTVTSGTRSSGYVFIRTTDNPAGEVLYYEGGTSAYCCVKNDAVSVTANGDTYAQAYMERYLASGQGAESYQWADFTTVVTAATLRAEIAAMAVHLSSISTDPVGTIKAYAGATEPSGFKFCNGQTLSIADYPALAAVLGTTYNTDGDIDEETQFQVPNLCGRMIAGYNANDYQFDEVGRTAGEKNHTLDITEIPAHNHVIDNAPNLIVTSNTNEFIPDNGSELGLHEIDNVAVDNVIVSAGGGLSHNNLPPYMVLNYIIATGVNTITA